MLLYIVRHGDPIYETDTLTDRGRLQAEAVGKRIFDSKINRIFSSPMGRAKETAAPACRLLGLDYTIEEWTHEIHEAVKTPYPDGQIKSISRLQNTVFREEGGFVRTFDEGFDCKAINQSGMKDIMKFLEAKGNDFLERLGYRYENGVYRIVYPNEEKVALFCHAAFTRAWLAVLFHIPINMMWASFDITHTGVTVLEFRNNPDGFTAPKCLCLSDISHLYAEGMDLLHNNRIEL